MERKVHKIDAQGKIAGRLATRIAVLLQGKHKVDYQLHIDSGDIVEVENVAGLKFSGKKLDTKVYYRTTGYPGGIRTKQLKNLIVANPAEVLRKTVWNMLPKNKLRPRMLKRLNIK